MSIEDKLETKLSEAAKLKLQDLTSVLNEHVIFDVDDEAVMIFTKIEDIKYLIGYLYKKDEFNFYIHRYELGQAPTRLFDLPDIINEIRILGEK